MPESKKPSGTQSPPNASGQPSRPKRRRSNRGGAKKPATASATQTQPVKTLTEGQPTSRPSQATPTSAWQGVLNNVPQTEPKPEEILRPELVKRIHHTSAFHVPDSKMLDLLVRAGLETNNTFNPERLKAQMKDDHFHSFMNLVKASIDTYIKDMQLDPN